MIKVVCLDLDGVFFLAPHHNLIQNLSEKFSLESEYLEEVLFKRAAKEGGYKELKLGKIPSDQYWNWLINTLNLKGKATKEDFLIELQRGYEINPKARELIKELHRRDIQVAVCSNNYRDNIERLEKNFDLSKFFDIMIFSYEVGVMKPEKQIYQELIKESRGEPGQILYFDDDLDNVAGARKLGIQSFVYQDFKTLEKRLSELGVI